MWKSTFYGSHFFGHSSSFSLVEIVASWASSTTSAGNTRDFGSFFRDYICGIFKGIFNGILILIHVYIYIYIVIVIIIDGIFNGIFNGIFDISTNTCVYIYIYLYMLLIGFLQRNTTGIMVWYHQQCDISGMIEISTISHGRPRDVQHGPKKCWWS